MKKKRCPIYPTIVPPSSSKLPLLLIPPSSSLSNVRGSVKHPMSPSSRRRQQSKEWEQCCMDFYAASPEAVPLPKVDEDSRKLYWEDHMHAEAFFNLCCAQAEDDRGRALSHHVGSWSVGQRGWESSTFDVISQTSNSSPSREEQGGRTHESQACGSPLLPQSYRDSSGGEQFLKQNIASRLALLERESSFKQSITMFSPQLLSLNDDDDEEKLMRQCFFSMPEEREFSVRRMHRNVIERADKTTPMHNLGSATQTQKKRLAATVHEALKLKADMNSVTESMSEQSYLTSSSRSRACSNRMRKGSGLHKSKYQKEAKSAAGRSQCARCFHSSGYQDNGKGGESSEATADAQCCSYVPQAYQSEDQSNLKYCEGTSSTIETAEPFQLAVAQNEDLALCEARPRCSSQKYRPRAFGEIVGQHIVSQSLSNAIIRGKIAPVYLFQGPRGTGKTSAARIFAAALVCIAPRGERPCGLCTECSLTWSGKNAHVKEVDAASHNGIAQVQILLQEVNLASASSLYHVFVIDECHVLTTETWTALLKILEEPPLNVVMILITTDPDQMPRTAVSRCQKFPFPKIKDADIVSRLRNVASYESIQLDLEVLRLIASRADGSLRDAEMILDQLALLGQGINSSTVCELVGSASEDKLLSLLESALLADTVNTIKKTRELVDSGVPPMSLMSQMASLIISILAGSYEFTEKQRNGFFQRETFSESKMVQLRKAVKILSEGEKQLRQSHDRMIWLTATLLQLSVDQPCVLPMSGTGKTVAHSPMAVIDAELEVPDPKFVSLASSYDQFDFQIPGSSRNTNISTRRAPLSDKQENAESLTLLSLHSNAMENLVKDREFETTNSTLPNLSVDEPRKECCLSASKLADIWSIVVQNCRPFRLQQSLHGHGKLVSISYQDVNTSVHLEFLHPEHKTRCERFQRNISDLFETVLRCPVNVKISLNPKHGLEQQGPTFQEQNDPKKSGTSCINHGITARSEGGHCNTPEPPDMDRSKTISQPPTGSSLQELLEDQSWWRMNASMSRLPIGENPNEAKVLSSEEQLDKAWICDDPEESSPSTATVKMCYSETVNQNPKKLGAQSMPTTRTHCFEAHGWFCEEVKEVVELHSMRPPSFHGAVELSSDVSEKESWDISSSLEGCGSARSRMSKVLRYPLAFRSRNSRSFPARHPRLLTEMDGPPFTIGELHRNPRSTNDTRRLGNLASALSSARPGETKALAAPQLRRSKLKGAAGTIARFFQGKLTSNAQDE